MDKQEIALKPILAKIEDAPEALRPLYVEDAGKFRLAALDGMVEEIKQHRIKDREQGSTLTDVQAKLAHYAKFGTPQEIQAAKEIADQFKATGGKFPDVEEIRKSIKAQIDQNVDQEKAQLKARNAQLTKQVDSFVFSQVHSDLRDLADLNETGKLVFDKIVKDRVQLKPKEDGSFERIFLDGESKPLLNAHSEMMKEADFVARLRTEYKGLFNDRPSGPQIRSTGKSQPLAQRRIKTMTDVEKTQYIKDYGQKHYEDQFIKEFNEAEEQKLEKKMTG
jgi:hypothetical protein